MTDWRWYDLALPLCIAALVAFLAVKGARMAQTREEAKQHCAPTSGCDWEPGEPCGCVPDHGPCVQVCTGCCDNGCASNTPPPTSAR